MSISVPDPKRQWHSYVGLAPVRVVVARADLVAGEWAGASAAGFPIELGITPVDCAVDADHLAGAAAAVIEVDEASQGSLDRFAALAKGELPIIAAAHDPSLAFVRSLMRMGAHDVIPLPLDVADLETSLAPLRERFARRQAASPVKRGKLVTIIKSVGGVGATMIASQLAVRVAARQAAGAKKGTGAGAGFNVGLLDLDLQFGDAAFQLGLRPGLSLADLLNAGSRLDLDLLRSTTTPHASGLKVIAAPPTMLPLDAMSSQQVIDIVDHATREFDLTFVDLPTNWSNWSLSLIARSDLVLLIAEVSVSSLNRARRQLDLVDMQDLGNIAVNIVINRAERGMFKTIRAGDVREALGREIAFTIANDHALVRGAIERGVPVEEIKRKSALAKDLDTLGEGVMTSLGIAS